MKLFLCLVFLIYPFNILVGARTNLYAKEVILSGGYSITISKAPYHAQIHRNDIGFCGAAIIDDLWLISAAHCLMESLEGLEIVTDSTYAIKNNKFLHATYSIDKVIIHPNFNKKTLDNDICLIKISTPIYKNRSQREISLAYAAPQPDDKMIISGFGQLGVNLPPSFILQKVEIPVVDKKECISRYASKNIVITDSMFCAGREGKGACPGDSGSPGVINDRLAGIVSGGYSCESSNFPGIFTRVDIYRDWINHTMIIEA